MKPQRTNGIDLKRTRQGFAIVSAIFILVVLAALGAFILNVFTNQQIGSALDVQGARAYQAARTGIEWGVYQVQATAAYNFSYGTPAVAVNSANPNTTRVCPVSPSSFTPPAAASTLSGFTVTVTCLASADGNNGPTVFSITSVACNQPNNNNACPNTTNPGSGYVERRLDVVF
jgi:MSHA biogenesis protein MshP